MPYRELGSNKRYLTVLGKHETVQLLIVLTTTTIPIYSRQTEDIHCNLWDNCDNISVCCFVVCSWCCVDWNMQMSHINGEHNSEVWS